MSRDDLEAVRRHPRLEGLGRSPREQERLGDFAVDLASWLVGAPESGLGPLAQVVTRVASAELALPKAFCRGRPLLAVEASARATVALWPWIRGPEEAKEPEERDEPEPEPEPQPEGDGGGGQDGPGGGLSVEGDGDGEPSEGGQPGGSGGQASSAGPSPGEAQPSPAESPGEPDEKQPEEGDPDDQTVQRIVDELGGGGDGFVEALARKLAEGLANEPLEPGEAPPGPQKAREAAREAAKEAAKEASEGARAVDSATRMLERLAPGTGWSLAPGAIHEVLLSDLEALAEILRKAPELMKLADALGRLEDEAKGKGARDRGRDEVVGVQFAGEIADALPSEWALLGDDDTEDLFYLRYAEQRLLSLQLRGTEDEGLQGADKKGPVIACIDTSGSMQGARELCAKALVLALVRRIVPSGRAVHLLLFGGPDECIEVRMIRGKSGLAELLAFLVRGFGGGTDVDVPLLKAAQLLDERDWRAADILVLTDGLFMADERVIDVVQDAKRRRGARVSCVLLGSGHFSSVQAFADRITMVDPRSPSALSEFASQF